MLDILQSVTGLCLDKINMLWQNIAHKGEILYVVLINNLLKFKHNILYIKRLNYDRFCGIIFLVGKFQTKENSACGLGPAKRCISCPHGVRLGLRTPCQCFDTWLVYHGFLLVTIGSISKLSMPMLADFFLRLFYIVRRIATIEPCRSMPVCTRA